MAVVAPIVGWLIPGGGHILLKRYGRGILLLVSVVAMFVIGLGMQGRIYKPNGGDILDILGFIGDVGSGALYFLARIMDWGNVMAANAAADYGKTFLIVAGLLELYRGGGCASHCAGEETVSINLSHFSAAVVFALFASVVFGITQRSSTMEQVKYGLYCFAMFVGGVFAAGWVMALIRR